MDLIVSTGEGKTRTMDTRTTVYRKTDDVYQLKMKASRGTIRIKRNARVLRRSQGLVPAYFALIIIIVVHVVKHQRTFMVCLWICAGSTEMALFA